MVTFTLLDDHGQPLARNLSPQAAAHRLLTQKGRDYDILPHPDHPGFILWTMAPGGPFQCSAIVSAEEDEESARDEIFAAVLDDNRKEHGITVVDDAEYELWLSGYENE